MVRCLMTSQAVTDTSNAYLALAPLRHLWLALRQRKAAVTAFPRLLGGKSQKSIPKVKKSHEYGMCPALIPPDNAAHRKLYFANY